MSDFDQDLAHLHRALAEHVRRDQPLARALAIVSEECEDKALREAVGRIRLGLEAGSSVGDAWMQGAPAVPPFYGALIEAAAQSGDLATALDQIAEHAGRSASLTGKLRQALFGPIVTAIACVVFGVVAAVVAGPRLAELTQAATGKSPMLFAFIGAGILIGFVVLAMVITRMRSPMAKGRFGVPVIGPLRLHAVRADLASSLALLLRRGVSLPRAAELVGAALPPGAAQEAAARMHTSASHGAPVLDALESSNLFEQSSLWLVDAADGSDDVVDALDDIADLSRRRLGRGVERMGIVARPVAEVVVGVAVFFFAYSYVSPLLDYFERFLGF